MPCSLLLYICMGFGSLFFFLTVGAITNLRMPDINQGMFARDIYIYLGGVSWTMLMFFATFLFVKLKALSRAERATGVEMVAPGHDGFLPSLLGDHTSKQEVPSDENVWEELC